MEQTKRPRTSLGSSCCALILLGGIALGAPAQTQTSSPDNSGNNKGQQVTAEQQSGQTSDRDLTAKIRRSVVDDKSLSTYAHNVKIITTNGAVTLKGPVQSEQEKQQIADKAAAVVGPGKVDNQLTVKQ
jgi:osmotically-inducible protein OsmY